MRIGNRDRRWRCRRRRRRRTRLLVNIYRIRWIFFSIMSFVMPLDISRVITAPLTTMMRAVEIPIILPKDDQVLSSVHSDFSLNLVSGCTMIVSFGLGGEALLTAVAFEGPINWGEKNSCIRVLTITSWNKQDILSTIWFFLFLNLLITRLFGGYYYLGFDNLW